jgi:hypothetical protein
MGCDLVNKFLAHCYRKRGFLRHGKGGFHGEDAFLWKVVAYFCFFLSDLLSVAKMFHPFLAMVDLIGRSDC